MAIKHQKSSSRAKGIGLVVSGAFLWGISGTVAQYLFQRQSFSPEWLVVVRLLISGILLLGWAYKKEKHKVWEIWRNKRDALSLIIFGFLGMLAVQYTYFAAILHGNAATATILQYLAPVIITCYLAVRSKRMPTHRELTGLILALLGTFLLVTRGSFTSLSISGLALFWGISSAIALAIYTLQPHFILKRWGAKIVVGWGMLIGGIGFSFVRVPWDFEGQWSLNALIAVFFIIVFETLIAFYSYLESLKYLNAAETSLLASVEPLSAAFSSILWLHVVFGFAEWLGTLCIIGTIVILSTVKKQEG